MRRGQAVVQRVRRGLGGREKPLVGSLARHAGLASDQHAGADRRTSASRPNGVRRANFCMFRGALMVGSDGLHNLTLQALSPVNNLPFIYT